MAASLESTAPKSKAICSSKSRHSECLSPSLIRTRASHVPQRNGRCKENTRKRSLRPRCFERTTRSCQTPRPTLAGSTTSISSSSSSWPSASPATASAASSGLEFSEPSPTWGLSAGKCCLAPLRWTAGSAGLCRSRKAVLHLSTSRDAAVATRASTPLAYRFTIRAMPVSLNIATSNCTCSSCASSAKARGAYATPALSSATASLAAESSPAGGAPGSPEGLPATLSRETLWRSRRPSRSARSTQPDVGRPRLAQR
mmetsp:Transcript_91799/g.264762  ORF Transcript_91799/g.264762 Transcript_91799/m.264762 type:complete len:257 (+) Transcript_91799:537-1307(+)